MPIRPRWVTCAVGLLVAVLLLAGRVGAQTPADTSGGIESIREVRLPNGLRVVIAVDHRTPQVALRIEYAVGDALDPVDQRGVAQLIGAALPNLGTRHLRAAERKRLLQAAGFEYEAPAVSVGPDTTAVTLQFPPEALELALWLEADKMGFAADTVTQMVLNEVAPRAKKRVEIATTASDAFVPLRACLGSAHPYGALDRPAGLHRARAVGVAERLRRYYNPQSAVLVLVGDVDPNAAEQAVRRLFGPLASAPITPPPSVKRATVPQLLSFTAAIPAQFSALSWETSAYLAPDDAALDVVATLLTRRLEARSLCDKIWVGQRSMRLTGVFVASCEAPKISSDTWRAALQEELTALAQERVPASEISSAARRWTVIAGDRYDDLFGRAAVLAASVMTGRGLQIVPQMIQSYAGTDTAQVASIVRRHLLRPADGQVEIRPADITSASNSWRAGEADTMFRAPNEARRALAAASADWPRPPAKGPTRRFVPPTGPTETLPNGDQLRFVERTGVPVAYLNLQIPWPDGELNAAAASALAPLLERSTASGQTLEDALKQLGAELDVEASAELFMISLRAPSSQLAAAFDRLGAALADPELAQKSFEAVKALPSEWRADERRDVWKWYWSTLGLSAPKTRYRYISAAALKGASDRLKAPEVAKLWQATQKQQRAVAIVGPFDNATARTLAAKLFRTDGAGARRAAARQSVRFQHGVYVLDREPPPTPSSGEASLDQRIDVCVLWPLPPWVTPGHYAAHLMPFFFRTDGRDGLGARFAEHDATIPYWQSNTLLTRDGDFLRYSFRAPVEQLAPILESLKDHLARLSAGQFAQADFADAIADERQFQVRQSQAGRSLKDALCRAATHDRQANEALDIASQLDRLSPRALSDLAKTLTFEKATIGIRGPVGPVTESLKKLGLKPTTVTPPEPPAANTGASAP